MRHRTILLLCAMTLILNSCTSTKPTTTATEPSTEAITYATQPATEAKTDATQPATEPNTESVSQPATEPLTQPNPPETISETKSLVHVETENKETTDTDWDYPDDTLYMGEFLDSAVQEPNLEIEKIEDGRYLVQIGIYRLAFLSDGDGKMTADGMIFTATDPSGNPISGIIKVEDRTATVTFTDSTWEYLPNGTSYQYTKSSDTPNIWHNPADSTETPVDSTKNDSSLPLSSGHGGWSVPCTYP